MIPKEIVQAVIQVQTEVGTLGKGDFNPHGKYRYVGIDKYYERVASVATKHGLTWVSKVTSSDVVGEKSMRFTYSFDVMHVSGQVAEGMFSHPIVHPVQGAQTAGSALSYADKLFMRHVFKVQTGEADADATDPNDLDLTPAPPPPPKPVAQRAAPQEDVEPEVDEGLIDKVKGVTEKLEDGLPVFAVPNNPEEAEIIAEIFTQFVDGCDTMPTLKKFWNQNLAALEKLAKIDADRHAKVKTAFTARRNHIEKKEKARG